MKIVTSYFISEAVNGNAIMATSSKTNKGMVRSDRSKPADFFFFTARVHTTKSTVKIKWYRG
jgi:hypothetical protein